MDYVHRDVIGHLIWVNKTEFFIEGLKSNSLFSVEWEDT